MSRKTKQKDNGKFYGGRSVVEAADGAEVAYYDPTEAVEEYFAGSKTSKILGGLKVDAGKPVDLRAAKDRLPGNVVAVAKNGEEEPFDFLKFPSVAPKSADDANSAMLIARGVLRDNGLKVGDFLSFDVTTHYYYAPLGKKECGWSFTFHNKPFNVGSL